MAACAVATSLLPCLLRAQEIPRDAYLSYVPLEVPPAFRQTEASARLHLYGDPDAPGYRDEDLDGIDDDRADLLRALAVRFAPLMVMNSTAVPMDLRRVTAVDGAFPLNIDDWVLDRPGGRLEDKQSFDVFSAVADPCTDAELEAGGRKADCRLRWLLREYDTESPASGPDRTTAQRPGERRFRVLWVDYPGRSESDWNRIYIDKVSGRLPRRFHDRVKTYVHPFIHRVGTFPDSAGYELVLQYWFFYPWNDGGNNHLGDWEHLNVVVSPLGSVTRPQTEAEMLGLLDRDADAIGSGDRLVIRRLDYYFHSKVWTLDFSTPNAYAPSTSGRRRWTLGPRARGEDWFWRVSAIARGRMTRRPA